MVIPITNIAIIIADVSVNNFLFLFFISMYFVLSLSFISMYFVHYKFV